MSQIIDQHIVLEYSPIKRLSDYAIGVFDDLPSRKSVKKAILENRILVDDEVANTGTWIKNGMVISLLEPKYQSRPEYTIDIPVIYEDDFLAVVNKPGGMLTSGNVFRSLENTLSHNLNITGNYLPRPVHRLDSATCGLVLIAKDKNIRIKLGELLKVRLVKKEYHAVVTGTPPDTGEIKLDIEGKKSKTIFYNLEKSKDQRFSLLKLIPVTGRTHQLRIHCSRMGFPIVGDKLYNGFNRGKGLFLCASKIEFDHPVTGERLKVKIDLPLKFRKLFNSD
ncbi:RluA family pseudouridine synthase [Marinigracilibium pacificum]|uniref:RluA family pseudouridine synthase n=1 Tax=Marinigracilibium pacificum TaxID=2729599 RepID=A0A848J151_9BACT|nr:RluA family pseudouridine synthase [Marinigracilibium pacificum]NMM49245.1 RluA family pseudouridine synthase [Marinigracilibium pacificum]